MAKQRGLHQIKGKVGEYSYYSQTGVSGGLIRKINEGLSARVKSDAAYANTRLNNQEFGAAAETAALLGKTVVPKFRPMILPFSQSKMAKEILKVARENTANWGQRVVTSADTAKLCEILSAQSKLNALDYVELSIARTAADEADLEGVLSSSNATMLASLGITNLTITGSLYDIATGQWVPLAQQMSTGYYYRQITVDLANAESISAGVEKNFSETIGVNEFIPEANHAGHQIVVFVVMPSRDVNGVTHILQEYCSFVAMQLPAYE